MGGKCHFFSFVCLVHGFDIVGILARPEWCVCVLGAGAGRGGIMVM